MPRPRRRRPRRCLFSRPTAAPRAQRTAAALVAALPNLLGDPSRAANISRILSGKPPHKPHKILELLD